MARRSRFRIIVTPRHAIFFFAFFLIGAAMLSLAKVVPLPVGLERFIIVGLSVVLMLTYCVFVTVVPATRLRMDVAADNMYYLGFLYTLSSLAVALTVDDTDKILANFGVAISSTLIGIAARVSLNQLRVDPQDVEAATRLELSEATSRIRAELDDTVFQLTNFRTMNLQVMAEGYEEVQKNVEKASSDIFASIKELLEKSAAPLDILTKQTIDASEQIVESIEALKESNRGITSSNRYMIDQIEKATKALQSLSEYYADKGIIDEKMISGVRTEIEKLQAQITKEARDEFNNLSQTVEKSRETSENLESTQSRVFQETRDELKSLSDATEKTREASENLAIQQAQLVHETRNELKTVNDGLEKSQGAIDEIKDLQANFTAEAQNELKTIRSSVEKSIETSDKMEAQQNQFKTETQDGLKNLKSSVDKSVDASEKLEGLQNELKIATDENLKSVTTVVSETAAVTEKLEKSLSDVHEELKNLTEASAQEVVTKNSEPFSDKQLTDAEMEGIITNETADIDEGSTNSSANLDVFEKHNGYDIFRAETGRGYEAEGQRFRYIADARKAMAKLPWKG